MITFCFTSISNICSLSDFAKPRPAVLDPLHSHINLHGHPAHILPLTGSALSALFNMPDFWLGDNVRYVENGKSIAPMAWPAAAQATLTKINTRTGKCRQDV